jgi:hypothetical protein
MPLKEKDPFSGCIYAALAGVLLMVEAFSVSLVASTVRNQTIPERTNNR